jgi:hypothetical protein
MMSKNEITDCLINSIVPCGLNVDLWNIGFLCSKFKSMQSSLVSSEYGFAASKVEIEWSLQLFSLYLWHAINSGM